MGSEIVMSRVWTMPHQWTFKMKPVYHLLDKLCVGAGWIDPFAGEYSPAEITNDCRTESPAKHHLDGLEFLRSLPDNSANGALFDPPYSVEQALRCYTPKFKGTAGRAEYHAKCKDEIARILNTDGIAVCFGWDSNGIGKGRGFELKAVNLLCHGACHNDTIITVEQKINTKGV